MRNKKSKLKEIMESIELDMEFIIDELVVDYHLYLMDVGFYKFNQISAERLITKFEKEVSLLSMEEMNEMQTEGIFALDRFEKYRRD